jgi:hypothetical protein
LEIMFFCLKLINIFFFENSIQLVFGWPIENKLKLMTGQGNFVKVSHNWHRCKPARVSGCTGSDLKCICS